MIYKLKTALNRHCIQTLALYVFFYLVYSFVEFEIVNPFLWIENIPTYEPMERFGLLGGWMAYTVISLSIHNDNTT